MIHTDGKPTIANTRLMPNPALAALERAVEHGRPIDWDTIAPVRPAMPDADSMPGGYDNPQEPYDWDGE
jgi:hypothetical protein